MAFYWSIRSNILFSPCTDVPLESWLSFFFIHQLSCLRVLLFDCRLSFTWQDLWTFHRNGEDWRSNRVILNKEVISPKVLENFVPLLDEVGEDFVARVHKKIARSGQSKWSTDLSQELFKYALECKIVSNPLSTEMNEIFDLLCRLTSFIYFSQFGVMQRWALCCTGSGWVCCWTTLILKLSISSTASVSCSRQPPPCCTYRLLCWGRLERRCGATMWRLGTVSLTKVLLRRQPQFMTLLIYICFKGLLCFYKSAYNNNCLGF